MRQLCIAVLVVLVSHQAEATIHRVSNTPGSTATFSTIQAAHDSALPFDTLMVEPWFDPGISTPSDSLLGYAPTVISKNVVIIGNGYFNDQLFPERVMPGSSRIQRLSLTSGASGTSIHGVDAAKIQIGANGVTVQHSRVQHLRLQSCGNAKIQANFIEGGYPGLPAIALINATFNQVVNNIVIAPVDMLGTDQYCLFVQSGAFGNSYNHNVFDGGLLSLQDAVMANSIFSGALLQDFGDAFIEFCIFSTTGVVTEFDSQGIPNTLGNILDPTLNNQLDIDLLNVFDSSSVSPDGSFDIQPTSVADGTSNDGGNIGAFDVDGYALGGFAKVPVVALFDPAASDQHSGFIPATFQLIQPDFLSLSQAEYYVDVDPGFGLGQNMNIPVGSANLDYFVAMSLQGFAVGEHTVGIRTRDVSGTWGLPVEFKTLKEEEDVKKDLLNLKAFWDNDPGYGDEEISLSASAADDDGNLTQVAFEDDLLPLLDFNPGLHVLHIRPEDANQVPGVTYVTHYLVLDDLQPQEAIATLTAFWDDDPGYGNEEFTFVGSTGAFNEFFDVDVFASGLQPGMHHLYWRSYDNLGAVSVTYGTAYIVQDESTELAIQGLEYFWDDDPGYGEAIQLDAPPAGLIIWEEYFNNMPPSTLLSLGNHTLTVRSVDVEGNWSVSVERNVLVVEELTIIDVNGDMEIGTADLLSVIAAYTCDTPDPACAINDLNFSTVVDSADILMILANYGINL